MASSDEQRPSPPTPRQGAETDPDATPPWAWSIALGLALTALVALASIAYVVAWEGDRAELEEHRSLYQARAMAHVASQHGPDKAQAYASKVAGERVPEVFAIVAGGEDEFGITRGQVYVAVEDAKLRGKDLTELRSDPRHKRRGDRFAFVVSGMDAVKRPGRASPEFALERDAVDGGAERWAAQVPFVRKGARADGQDEVGSAGASVTASVPSAPVPWVLLLVAALVLWGGGAFAFGRVGRSEPTRDKLLLAAIAVSGLVVLGVTAGHYNASVEAQQAISGEAMAASAEAAKAIGLDGGQVEALVRYADVSYTGEAGYGLGTSGALSLDALGDQVVAHQGGGRSGVIWATVLLVLAVMLGVHRFLVDLAHALRTDPHAYAYIGPSMLGMVLLVFVPFGFGVGLSLFDNDAKRYYFVGAANFIEILGGSKTSDVSFYWTLFVTFLWTFANVVLHVSIGLALALLLKAPTLRFKAVYRVLLIIPWAVPNYITALIWKGMFNKEFGAVNLMLEKIQLFFGADPSTIESIDWLGGSFATAFTANLVTNTWLGFPFMMVVALGALQSIPGSLYEAAEVDGASRWQQFVHITLPLLKPALFPAIILGSIWTFNMFNIIYLVSGGGPNNSTEILITDAYRAFDVLGRYGFAAAYSVLIFVILLLYTAVTNRVTQATEGAFE